jgi:nucleotide-binding universal stress UspA family protein
MYSNILVPLAPDHGAVSGPAMAVARVLLAPGGRITVMTVLEAIPDYVQQYLPLDQEVRNRAEMAAALEAEFGGQPDVSHMVRSGHPAQTILDTAEAEQFDCVVIASHRPGLQDYFLGSTAARVVRHARCSVHVLR